MGAQDGKEGGSAEQDVDPLGDPYLPVRTAVPARPHTFLRRERLRARLDGGLGTPLIMVNGAAGAGKTLLVADWAAGLEEPAVWFTVGAGEAPGQFWAYLLEALRTRGVPVPDDVGCPADANQVDHKLLSRLAVGLSALDRPVVVVLDEFDRVTSAGLTEQVEFVLHHAARGLRLVLVTRTEPLLPLHRYRAAGTMTEIRNAELAFTPEEAAALLKLHGLDLSVQAAGSLVERTGGWAAGLRLSALAARETLDPRAYLKEFEAGQSTVADFLLAEVLKRQPDETQELLLRVSVLERFCPDLANALTGRGDAGPILDELRRQNAFVDQLGHSWYRLHPLFREILRSHLEVRAPGLAPVLHGRAARWLRHAGFLPEALTHGAAAGDWEFTATALVDDLAIGELFTGLRTDTMDELFSRMTPEARGPAADLVRAARALSHGDVDHGLAHLHRAEETLAAETSEPAAARLTAALLEVHTARLGGEPDKAEKAAERARQLQVEVPERLLDEHPELNALLLTHLGTARLWAGRFDEAREALSAVVGATAEAATALPRQECLGHLALIDYLAGWPSRAERKALAAQAETERFGLPPSAGSGVGPLVRAAVAVERDELGEAQGLLEEAASSGLVGQDPVLRAGRAIASGRLMLALGDARAALAAVEPVVAAGVGSPWVQGQAAAIAGAAQLAEGRAEEAARTLLDAPEDQVACRVEAARALVSTGRPDRATALLDAVPPGTAAGPAVTVRALLVRAQAADRAGDTAGACRALGRALALARRERLRRPFLEAGPWVRPLLETEPLAALADGWLGVDAHPPGRTVHPKRRPARPEPLVVEDLSAREHDVLVRLSRMMSTEEIAEDLHVSANTVKTHLKSVYRKLAVNRRTEAVRRGRERGLL
ncbi:LuxR C-terminal-related transcriptional regulator [Streptomyces sp. NPDC058739]|uniref:LuxR C-terminal-related transcriptional regulator n=1 Tax=Streptomyces sp. NPDC058739 TaxID=3346618 RepID=UPI0036BD1933